MKFQETLKYKADEKSRNGMNTYKCSFWAIQLTKYQKKEYIKDKFNIDKIKRKQPKVTKKSYRQNNFSRENIGIKNYHKETKC